MGRGHGGLCHGCAIDEIRFTGGLLCCTDGLCCTTGILRCTDGCSSNGLRGCTDGCFDSGLRGCTHGCFASGLRCCTNGLCCTEVRQPAAFAATAAARPAAAAGDGGDGGGGGLHAGPQSAGPAVRAAGRGRGRPANDHQPGRDVDQAGAEGAARQSDDLHAGQRWPETREGRGLRPLGRTDEVRCTDCGPRRSPRRRRSYPLLRQDGDRDGHPGQPESNRQGRALDAHHGFDDPQEACRRPRSAIPISSRQRSISHAVCRGRGSLSGSHQD
mmetsp:Transcript_38884/g.112311  ORF Transcript_38884/g.112311 Transcript_38884/m.112311 type:complete len:272 (+) Transcript_38884:1122-1937(+)